MSPKNAGALLLLSALWGGSFLFMRIAAPAFGPILLIELRVLLAGLTLLGFAALSRKLPPLNAHWGRYLAVGAINSAIPFVLIATAELRLPASLAATLNATTPLFGALVSTIVLKETLSIRKVGGLLLGLTGVAILVGLGPLPLTSAILWSIGASLLAALAYGVGAVYTKVALPNGQPQALALYSQLSAALVLMPLVPFAWPATTPAVPAIYSLALLALLCTAFAYVLYFYLIVNVGPTRATMVTYLSPAFGMLWGALFLHESLGLAALVGFGLILSSVLLVSGMKAPQRGVARPQGVENRG